MPGNWRPAVNKNGLKERARLFAATREFFRSRGITEVDTPVLSRFASCDPNIRSLESTVGGKQFYLHTSPEFFMKRMLAAGSGDIYSIARVFRDDETGQFHNPEFVMLEWYRLNFDLESMAKETVELLTMLLGLSATSDFAMGTYSDVFVKHAGVDPLLATDRELKQIAIETGLDCEGMDRDGLLDVIAGSKVFPELGKHGVEVISEFPAAQAALAEIDPGNPAIAERFEVFLDGIELANGFRELRDANEQQTRFEADNRKRRQRDQPEMPIDRLLLEALAHGLPVCSGVAVGLDRVFMLALSENDIGKAMSFPLDKC